MQRDPVRYLESRIFIGQPAQVDAVGFKIFYYHARSAAWQPIWSYLVEQRDLHVIHVKRANILRTHLSRKRAALTQKWMDMDGQPAATAQIPLDYAECLHDFEQTRRWEQEYDELFTHHPKLDVVYEELAADLPAMVDRVQAFLGLPRIPLTPKTHRQSRQPLAESVANFADLRARFAGTSWSHFFDE
jgi:LPS sulfotransferase NodH